MENSISYPISKSKKKLPMFLADTWWFGLTNRISEDKFYKLAKKRKEQQFDAVQMVVGIPPEVGATNKNVYSACGPAWSLDGKINQDYLNLARSRIEKLNKMGIKVIVYGAWGHQIDWMNTSFMNDWWSNIVKKTNDLNVIYCLSGESDLWVDNPNKLLPDKSTDDLLVSSSIKFLPNRIISPLSRIYRRVNKYRDKHKLNKRQERWSKVLNYLHDITNVPIIVHPLPNEISQNIVRNPEYLSALTVQTGHDHSTRDQYWKIPGNIFKENPSLNYINLEPWYEGIRDSFGIEDQLYAYWTSMMSGASAYCYGAHGIWNIGDGKFLSHWGTQTIEDAINLPTPDLIGKSHKFFVDNKLNEGIITINYSENTLVNIRHKNNEQMITYYPDVMRIDESTNGEFFNPQTGLMQDKLPTKGAIVIKQN